jgi:hypothetical protein
LASGGYPGSYQKGKVITGIEEAEAKGAEVFHAGTQLKHQQLVSDGGRVLGVTATGETLEQAISKAYAAVDCIQFEGVYCRRDIGRRALGDKKLGIAPYCRHPKAKQSQCRNVTMKFGISAVAVADKSQQKIRSGAN